MGRDGGNASIRGCGRIFNREKNQTLGFVLSFLIAALVTVALRNWGRSVMSTSLIFFAAIMITEPLTAPPTRRLRIIYIDTEVRGHVDQARMAREIPDYRERTFYISGSHGAVTAFEGVLKQLKIPKRQIVTDYFPGFV